MTSEAKRTGLGAKIGDFFLNKPLGFAVVSVLVGVVVGGVILAIGGYSPFESYAVMLRGVFSSPRNVAAAVVRATPIIITGLSVAFAFQTGLFNIGAEGQFILGALVAALVGFALPMPTLLHIPVVIIAAALAGALWGGLIGLLKARFGVHEVISSIMLNWIAFYLNNFIIGLPSVQRPQSESTYKIAETARLDILGVWKRSEEGIAWRSENAGSFFADLLRADINWGIVFALILALIVWWILKKTTLGYELRAVGFNKDAAEYGGIRVGRSVLISMAIAGAIAGLAGALQVMGRTQDAAKLALMEGNGFNGIAVSLIGNNSPLGCVFAGFLFGGLEHGGGQLQARTGAPSEIVQIVIGTIMFFVAIPNLLRIVVKARKRRAHHGG